MGFGMFSVKMVAASAAVFSSAVALRLAAPAAARFLFEEAPRFCESLSAWLTPPYLYFVINGIIISIAATSRLQKAVAASDHPNLSAPPTGISEYADPATAGYIPAVAEEANLQPEILAPAIGSDAVDFPLPAAETDSEEGFVISRSSWSPRKRGSNEDLPEKLAAAGTGGGSTEKPPVSTRLGRRRSIKSSPEAGKPLGVARPKKHETLESTWRAITDGRPVPLAHHLKKTDTWETHSRAAAADIEPPPPSAMLKSETFSTRSVAAAGPSSQLSPSGSFSPTVGKLRRESLAAGKLRREPSLGQDDLNRRVEAFIKKFNEEMRLQRQNSLQQYMDMINRSSH